MILSHFVVAPTSTLWEQGCCQSEMVARSLTISHHEERGGSCCPHPSPPPWDPAEDLRCITTTFQYLQTSGTPAVSLILTSHFIPLKYNVWLFVWSPSHISIIDVIWWGGDVVPRMVLQAILWKELEWVQESLLSPTLPVTPCIWICSP